MLPENIPSDYIPIPEEMHIKGSNLLDLINITYPDFKNHYFETEYMVGRAILTPLNDDVSRINNIILDSIPGPMKHYFSNDQVCELENSMEIQVEFLNSIESGSLPPHKLNLKVGSLIMAIRNINPAAGVCNGTRLIVRSLKNHLIEAMIATGPKTGDIVCIPRIKFVNSATNSKAPFDFVRT